MKQVLLIGAIQGFVLSLALFRSNNLLKKHSNYLFSALILIVSSYLLIVSQNEYFVQFPKQFLTAYVLIYLYCPTYYLYVLSITDHKKVKALKNLAFFIPALLFLLLMVSYYPLSNDELLNKLRSKDIADLVALDLTSIIVNFIVLWKSWQLIKYWKNEQAFQKTGIATFYLFQVAMVASNIAWMLFLLPQWNVVNITLPFRLEFVYLGMSGLIFLFSYIIIAKNQMFFQIVGKDTDTYKNVSYDQQELANVSQEIIKVLTATKPYLEVDFSLGKLAELTGIERFKLSYTINNSMNSSFTRLINEYRIDEFLEMVNSEQYNHFNMLGVANEAGFKTKSTFYKAFKEIKGATPKEYLKLHNGVEAKMQPA
ncbi:helix-turn-helix domain-containing protein [Fulvivirga lutimaris]|uniref:helix-turn-helix domain-containing protein n=1 Tax=Fulvivirga lutimaris TaxID=1819566 RepID=UPI0012BC2E2C|nr:helix-turn-helix domain-containing protein [Fulvivirga lutimaris]MTI39843.1 AraC family transcriptional regulator [Fulvivirga lutimaris]